MKRSIQTTLNFEYGISREQACILCHLSAECSGCCKVCKDRRCQGQTCSQPFREHEGQRWDSWMHILRNTKLKRLVKYIPPNLREKYGIDKMIKRKSRRTPYGSHNL
nr:MAG TPA: hypothetical protein [Caudoviricetes sp.]